MDKRIVITGGSGFLGQKLAKALVEKGYAVSSISRSKPSPLNGAQFVQWDGETVGEWATSLEGAYAIVHLAGKSVDCPKTPENREKILRSRVHTTNLLGQAVRELSNPPQVWVQMSTAYISEDPESVVVTKDSEEGLGFAPEVGKAWESAFHQAVLPEMRQVVLRTSFVLGRDGGAMKRLTALAKWGLGGAIGHGRQGVSWVHIEDMIGLILRALENHGMEGIYVATAPNPVSNKVFMRALRKAMGIPFGLPAPAFAVRLGAKLLNTDPDMALYGRFFRSQRLEQEGFKFQYPNLDAALRSIV